jgi:tricorn protease-like protein
MAPMFKESQLLMVSNPIRISPNGQLIAFTGEYENMDVYVVSVDGGDPKG